MKTLLALFLVSILGILATSQAQEVKPALAEATSTDQIVQFENRSRGYGHPRWASFSNGEQPIFTIWNNPFSGRAVFSVRTYFKEKGKWILFSDRFVPASALSPMLSISGNRLVFLGNEGKESLSLSLKNLQPLQAK